MCNNVREKQYICIYTFLTWVEVQTGSLCFYFGIVKIQHHYIYFPSIASWFFYFDIKHYYSIIFTTISSLFFYLWYMNLYQQVALELFSREKQQRSCQASINLACRFNEFGKDGGPAAKEWAPKLAVVKKYLASKFEKGALDIVDVRIWFHFFHVICSCLFSRF